MPRSDIDQELVDAAEAGAAAKVSALLAEGADPMRESSSALRSAAAYGHAECLRLLLPVSDAKARESLALRLAARNGHAECVRLLAPASDPKEQGSLALGRAAQNGHEECVRMLLPVSGPLGEIDGLLEKVFHRGHAKVAALMIEEDPRILDGVDLSKCLGEALKKDHRDLASYLSAIIDQKELLGAAPNEPACRLGAARL